jgi:hypothetical protein
MIINLERNLRPFTLVSHPELEYLGVIQDGPRIGALAITPEGRYVQVNGAVVQPLKHGKVAAALARARRYVSRKKAAAQRTSAVPFMPAPVAPVVIVRPRRRVIESGV